MKKLSEESIKEFFREIGLETDDERSAFLKFSAPMESTESLKEQIFIRLENNTVPNKLEEETNA